ncbi:unnamed protein product, partial [Ectocarpus fasciculatus]
LASLTNLLNARFAPSPTGSLHVGGARTALFNWLLARQSEGGTFIVRVEDTDEARSSRESERAILADLRWLGLHWDEGPDVGGPCAPYRQSERKAVYAQYAKQLIESGHAYYCFCTDEEVAKMKEDAVREGRVNRYNGRWRDASAAEVQRKLVQGEPYTVRFRVPTDCKVSVHDEVRGLVTWDADAALGDFILLRSNGMPVYNFCVAVDDLTMNISHVIRAEEHLSNTLRQVLLFNAFGKPHPVYAHCSLILGADRNKLSKRHGAASISEFREAGYIPSGMINYLPTLGWNDGTTKEVYSAEELVKAFSLHKIIRSAAVFDVDKLNWLNSHHIKCLPPAELRVLLELALENLNLLLPSAQGERRELFLNWVVRIGQPLLTTTMDVREVVTSVLDYPFEKTMELARLSLRIIQDDFASFVRIILGHIENDEVPHDPMVESSQQWKEYTTRVAAETNRKGKRLFHPLRLALTGRLSGPDVGMQLQLVNSAAGVVSAKASSPVVSLNDRVKILTKYLEN